MKNRHLLLFLVVLLIATTNSFSQVVFENNSTSSMQEEKEFSQFMEQEVMKFYHSRRANQVTGKINPADIIKAVDGVKALSRNKSGNPFNLQWDEIGPNNFPGRTRAFLVDNENSNLLFSGSVSGGLWRSTVGGLTWERVAKADGGLFENLAVSCIAQASNGDVYFGTGEGHYYPQGNEQSGYNGQGIYKSTDRGSTFSRLNSTWSSAESKEAFVQVFEVACDPNNNNRVYAATAKGLRVSNDGGGTWFNPISGDDAEALAFDVKVASDGTVIVALNNLVYLSSNGDEGTYVLKSGANGTDDGLVDANAIGRLEFAFAPTDPNYVYCVAAGLSAGGSLRNVYRSTDKGETWKVIGPGGAPNTFSPLSSYGKYSMSIAVSPLDPKEIMLAGKEVWKWSDDLAWEKITYPYFDFDSDELFVHDRQHAIVYDMQHPDTVYVATNAGITRSIDGGFTYRRLNKSYNTTQFISVAASGDGKLIGGTIDNGTIYMDFTSADSLSGKKYYASGDYYDDFDKGRWNAGQVATSMMCPELVFFTAPFGLSAQLYLRDASGVPTPRRMWPASGNGSTNNSSIRGPLITAIDLYENPNDLLSNEFVTFTANRNYVAGEYITVPSYLQNKRPVVVKLDADLAEGETLSVQDPYGSVFVLGRDGQDGGVRMQRRALTLNARRNNTIWTIMPGNLFKNDDNVEYVEIGEANQGDVVYAAVYKSEEETNKYWLLRTSGLKEARNRIQTDARSYLEQIVHKTKVIAKFDQVITSIVADPTNDENLLLTLGNYGNETNIVYSTNAYTCGTDSAVFVSKQGNLPQMPVFTAIFDWESPNTVIIGTEYGVYSTRDISAGSPAWSDENLNGLQYVPVYDIDQQSWENSDEWGVYNHGVIYIATHGRGLFKSETRRGGGIKLSRSTIDMVSNQVKLSPNPANEYTNVSFELSEVSDVEISVYSLSGSVVKTVNLSALPAGTYTEAITLSDISSGTYIMKLNAEGKVKSSKFIVN